jgi:PilZ domain
MNARRAMTRLLAIEPNPERGALLRRLLREAVRAEVTVVPSTKAALTALSAQTPDLILTSSLISPTDDRDLVAHLRERPTLRHLPVLTMPPVAEAPAPERRGLLARLRRRRPQPIQPMYDFSAIATRIEEAIAQSKIAIAAAQEEAQMASFAAEPEIVEAPSAELIAASHDVFSIRKRSMRWASWQLPWFSSIRVPWGIDLRLINISRSGLLVESGSRIAPGATTSFRIWGPGCDVTIPARIVRSEVAKVDRLGVKYHAAAVFDYHLDTKMPDHTDPIDCAAHLDELVTSVLAHAEAGSRAADLRIEFEAGVKKLLTARDVRLRDVPVAEDNGCDSVYFTLAGSAMPAILQATFEPGYQPTADEFAALKAAAVAAEKVVAVTKTARQLTLPARTSATRTTAPLRLVPHAPASALELRPSA